MEPVTEIDASHSAPIVNVTTLSVSNPHPSADGSKILATVTIEGSLQSAFCDTIPGSDGAINSVQVFLNGSDTPTLVIPAVVSKGSQDSFLRPFPFSATFSQTIDNFELSLLC